MVLTPALRRLKRKAYNSVQPGQRSKNQSQFLFLPPPTHKHIHVHKHTHAHAHMQASTHTSVVHHSPQWPYMNVPDTSPSPSLTSLQLHLIATVPSAGELFSRHLYGPLPSLLVFYPWVPSQRYFCSPYRNFIHLLRFSLEQYSLP